MHRCLLGEELMTAPGWLLLCSLGNLFGDVITCGSGEGTIGAGTYGTIGHTGSGTAHAARVPTLVVAQADIVGNLDAATIRSYLYRDVVRIRHCYEQRLLLNPSLAGRINAHFTVARTGKVLASSADGVDAEVASCIAEVIKQIDFPAPEGGGVVQIDDQLTFRQP